MVAPSFGTVPDMRWEWAGCVVRALPYSIFWTVPKMLLIRGRWVFIPVRRPSDNARVMPSMARERRERGGARERRDDERAPRPPLFAALFPSLRSLAMLGITRALSAGLLIGIKTQRPLISNIFGIVLKMQRGCTPTVTSAAFLGRSQKCCT